MPLLKVLLQLFVIHSEECKSSKGNSEVFCYLSKHLPDGYQHSFAEIIFSKILKFHFNFTCGSLVFTCVVLVQMRSCDGLQWAVKSCISNGIQWANIFAQVSLLIFEPWMMLTDIFKLWNRGWKFQLVWTMHPQCHQRYIVNKASAFPEALITYQQWTDLLRKISNNRMWSVWDTLLGASSLISVASQCLSFIVNWAMAIRLAICNYSIFS